MTYENFTTKAQQALAKAQEIAVSAKHQAVEPAHLLKALLVTDENITPYLFKKLSVNISALDTVISKVIERFPVVHGGEMYFSSKTNHVLQKAQHFASTFHDEFISVEQLLLGLLYAEDETSRIMKDAGLNEKDLTAAIKELRKGATVNTQSAEESFNALNRYAINLNNLAQS